MPNWCANYVTIKGKKKDLIKIQELMVYKDNHFSCEKVLPTKHKPKNKSFSEYWGSKWDTDDTYQTKKIDSITQSIDFIKGEHFFDELDEISYSYSSAWSPISKAIAQLAEIFKEVYIIEEFSEEGMGVRGVIEYLNGLEIREIGLPLDEYDEEEGEYLVNEEVATLANSEEGYFDKADDLFKDSIFNRHFYTYD